MNKLAFLFLLFPFLLNAQKVTVKMGGANFIDCKSLVTFGGQEVVSIRKAADGTWLLNAEVYNEAGRLSASVHDNQTTATGVVFTQNANEIQLTDKYTGRKLCHFKLKTSADGKPAEIEATLNMYLPNGTLLQCTPEASNQTVLETMRGTTSKNKDAGYSISG